MLVVVQARSSSTRFPKKILHKIYGKTLIEHVILKISKSKNVSNIVVATSNNKSDDSLVDILEKNKIEYFRGGLKNVAKRLLHVAEKHKKKYQGGIDQFRKDCTEESIKSSEYIHLFKLVRMNADEFDLDPLINGGLHWNKKPLTTLYLLIGTVV